MLCGRPIAMCGGRNRSVLAEPGADDACAGGRPLLELAAYAPVGGVLAIDVAVVGKPAGVIVEQQLTAGPALGGHVQDRPGVDFFVVGGGGNGRSRTRPLQRGDIFPGGEQAGADQYADRDHAQRLAQTGETVRAAFSSAGAAVHGTAANSAPGLNARVSIPTRRGTRA